MVQVSQGDGLGSGSLAPRNHTSGTSGTTEVLAVGH